MEKDFKALIDALFDEIDKLGAVIGKKDYHAEAAHEMFEYLTYLAIADGKIEWTEIRKIGVYLGITDLNPQNMELYIKEHNICSEKYENTIPPFFKILVDHDNIMYAKDSSNKKLLSEIMLIIYKALGKELVESDGEVERYEYTNFYIYDKLLNDYLDKNLRARQAKN